MANQIIIDIGAAANDGTGDPLRTAFNDVNLNFANVWNTGLPTSNIQFSDNRVLTVNTNANLVLSPNGIGIVQSNVDVRPSADRGPNLGSPDKKWNTLYVWYANIAGGAKITGNISIDGNANITGSANVAGDTTFGSNVFVLGNLYANIDGNTTFGKDVHILGNLLVDGNVQFDGNVTYIDSTVVDIKDKNITLAYGSPNAQVSDGSGITVAGSNAQIYYNYAGNNWTFNLPIATTAIQFSDGSILDTGNIVYIGPTPNDKGDGNLWYNSIDGRGYVKYNSQWIDFNPPVIPNPSIYLGNLVINGPENSTLYFPPGGSIEFGDGTVQTTAWLGAISNIGNLHVDGTLVEIANGAPETLISVSPSGPTGWAYLQIPDDATANVADTRLHNDAGNVEIGTGDASNGGPLYTWLFDKNGNLTIPGNIVADTNQAFWPYSNIGLTVTANIQTDVNGISMEDGVDTNVYANSNVVIQTNTGNAGNTYSWTFDNAGNITFPDGTVQSTAYGPEIVYEGGSVSGTLTPNIKNGTIQKYTLVGNIALMPVANTVAGQSITLILTQDSVGNRGLSANVSYLFASGYKTLSAAGNSIDMLNIFYDGTTYYTTLTTGYA